MMNKSLFQMLFAGYVFAAFLMGVYVFYCIAGWAYHALKAAAEIPATGYVGALAIVVYAALIILGLLFAAIQIFRTGSWKIFKYLLYLSIPQLNIFGYFIYKLYFMPYLYVTGGYNTSTHSLLGAVDFGFYPLSFNFDAGLFGPSAGLFLIGVNIVPIMVIILLKKFYRPA
jgi:hypothetical protein